MSEIISLKRFILAKFWGFQSMTVFLLLWAYRIDRPNVDLIGSQQWGSEWGYTIFFNDTCSMTWAFRGLHLAATISRQIPGFVCVCGGGIQHLNHSRDLEWLWHPMRFFLGKCELFTSDGSLMADQRNNSTWVFLPEPMNLLGSLIRY